MLATLYSLFDHLAIGKDVTSVLLLLITSLFAWIALRSFNDQMRKRPPGPWGFPIVGYLPFMRKKAHHIVFSELVQKYGPVVSVKLGYWDCIILGSYQAIKEALIKQNENFSGRPSSIVFKVYDDEKAFIYQDGENWKDLRRFSVSVLRELGFGRQNLEPVVQSEIQFFVKALEDESSKHSEGFPVGAMVQKSIGNAICSLIIGHRCDYSDPWLTRMVEIVDTLQENYITDIAYYFPWTKTVPLLSKLVLNPKKSTLKKEFWELWKQKIEECLQDGSTSGLNFVSAWLEEYKKRLDNDDPKVQNYAEESFLSNVDLLCQAAFETTATTLKWAFLFMLEHPETQTKIQHEIDEVIGQERLPAYSDSKNMHFTRAFISETHRKGSILPLGVNHSNLESTYLMGYWIPKRCLILPHQYAVHIDPKIFPHPERFDASRFLDSDGKFIKHESVIPFSVGKRFCPGEFVAEMELFLYLTSLLQKYSLEAPSGLTFETVSKNTGINHPKKFNMCIKRRN